MITVKFKNVGRDKKSWTATMPELTKAALLKSVSRHGSILSQQVDCDIEAGEVIVGGWRTVGKFTVHYDGAETAVAQ